MEIILIYAIIQLLTTAYGIAVIESVKPKIEKKIYDEGYVVNKNSLYKFNSTISDILHGFIPFYYLTKAIKLITTNNAIEYEAMKEIKKGKYINPNEIKKTEIINIPSEEEKVEVKEKIEFEKEKYTARKNNYVLYDTYDSPVSYKEEISSEENSLTPFSNDSKVIQNVIVRNNPTNSDIAKAISLLDENELEILNNNIKALIEIKKRKNTYKLEKDVA